MVENQEEFDQKRFVLAMVISGIILIVWQFFFAPPPPPPTEEGTNGAVTQTASGGEVAVKSGTSVKLTDPIPTANTPDEAQEELPVEQHVLASEYSTVTLSTAGARLVAAEISKPEQYSAEGNLLKTYPEGSTNYPFAVTFTQNSIALRRGLVWAFVASESIKTGETYSKVTYRHTDPSGRYEVDKVYTLDAERAYMLELSVVVKNKLAQGVIADQLALDITAYNDPTEEKSFLDMRPGGLEGICRLEDDLERELFDSVDNPLVFDEEPTIWGGIDKRYFLFAAVPDKKAKKCVMDIVDEDYLRTRIVQPELTVQPGGAETVKYQIFVGPKDMEKMEAVGANLEESIDYGILTFLCRPLHWALVLFHGWLGNWGLAIILLTLAIRILTWPINQKVYVNSEKMKEIQPKLTEIKEKYKEDQTRQAEETMKIWKEHGVSPLGCLPMFLQFPILLALYFMILNSVELYQAHFAFWYVDLSAPDPYFILPLLMGVVMYAQQSFMTIDSPNPQMMAMMKFMPIMFTAFMLFLPSGVVLYYFVSLVLGLVQQYLIKRSYRAKAAAA